MQTPLIDVNYGLLENDEWTLEIPVAFADAADDGSHWGAGDVLFGWQYRFRDENGERWMASIYPQILLPTGNERFGLGNGDVEMLLPIETGRHFCDDRLFVYGNVGCNVVLSGPGENSWIYGAAAEWQKTEKLALVFEVAGVAFESDSEPDYAFFNAGLTYKLTDHLALIGSAGRGFPERSCGAPVLLTFWGIQITTGGGQADSPKPSPDLALPDVRLKKSKP